VSESARDVRDAVPVLVSVKVRLEEAPTAMLPKFRLVGAS
jgi:hypothetical protein